MHPTADEPSEQQLSKQAVRHKIFDLVHAASALSFLAAISVLGWQCYEWLRFGYWPDLTVQYLIYKNYRLLLYGATGWLGVDKIINWLIDAPVSLWLVVISFIGFWLVGRVRT